MQIYDFKKCIKCKKVAYTLVYVIYFLYLCSRFNLHNCVHMKKISKTSMFFAALAAMVSLLFAGCNGLTPDNYPSKSGKVVTETGEWEWSYTVEDHTLTISGTGEMTPEGNDYRNYPWQAEDTFRGAIHHISVKKGITAIGEKAFDNCYKVEEVSLPLGIKTIGKRAFCACSMKSVTIPNSVSCISDYAFEACTKLEDLQLNDLLDTIGHGAFSSCYNLTSLRIPKHVEVIKSEFVSFCSSLETMEFIPTTPPTIMSETFKYSSVKTIKVPKGCLDAYRNAEHWKHLQGIEIIEK